jgi:hypothetical protein
MNLSELGWDALFDAAFAPYRQKGWRPARVAVEDKHSYMLVAEAGEFTAKVAGRLLRQHTPEAELPKVGDWVAVTQTAGTEPAPAIIQAVLPRRTKVARKMPGREVREQVLAANIGVAFVVQALLREFPQAQARERLPGRGTAKAHLPDPPARRQGRSAWLRGREAGDGLRGNHEIHEIHERDTERGTGRMPVLRWEACPSQKLNVSWA